LDHFDLIAGKVTGLIDPASPDYSKDSVTTAKVIARFDGAGGNKDANGIVSIKWKDSGDGWKKVTYETEVSDKMYFRLRGTNHTISTLDETNAYGNPLPDIAEENNAVAAFSDLWFYSNPIFVETINQ
jgi:hypothetical protein